MKFSLEIEYSELYIPFYSLYLLFILQAWFGGLQIKILKKEFNSNEDQILLYICGVWLQCKFMKTSIMFTPGELNPNEKRPI